MSIVVKYTHIQALSVLHKLILSDEGRIPSIKVDLQIFFKDRMQLKEYKNKYIQLFKLINREVRINNIKHPFKPCLE